MSNADKRLSNLKARMDARSRRGQIQVVPMDYRSAYLNASAIGLVKNPLIKLIEAAKALI